MSDWWYVPRMSVSTRFEGMERLLGVEAANMVGSSHVCIVGIGGVGSWTAEALARSGIGAITLVDLDDVCVSNTNRQIHALQSTVGQFKVDVMAARIREINPKCTVHAICDFFRATNADDMLDRGFDVVVDAIDSFREKAIMVDGCRARNIPIVVIGGSGGRVDPTAIQLTDLNKTKNDPLLRRVRKQLRQKHHFPRGRKPWGIPAVWCNEMPVYPQSDGTVCRVPEGDNVPGRLDCATGYGAASFVTGTAGFFAASAAIRLLTQGTGDDAAALP